MSPARFEPPVYPFDRLGELRATAERHPGGAVDLSVGTPCDPPPALLLAALARSGSERGYPSAIGSAAVREAAAGYLGRRFGVSVDPEAVAVCVGTKEFVAGVPQWLRLRDPGRDVVLHPSPSYPTYAMGARLAGCRAEAVPLDGAGRLRLDEVLPETAARSLCLWVNSPGNPAGNLDDLAAAAAWGRERGIPVLSDECYAEFSWEGPPRSILETGSEGVLACHSLSKRSNAAGLRMGFYAGDPELVSYLAALRRHAGLMVAGPVQAAAAAALADDEHVEAQRLRYRARLELLVSALRDAGLDARMPSGSFYLWVEAPKEDDPPDAEQADWRLARALAASAGALVSPGSFYGPAGARHVRIAAVQPDDRIALVAQRLGRAGALVV